MTTVPLITTSSEELVTVKVGVRQAASFDQLISII